MIASDLQISLPTVNRRTPVTDVARLIARAGLAAVVLADDDGTPAALISSADVLRMLLVGHEAPTVGDLLDDERALMVTLVRVEPGTPLRRVAEQMASSRAPVAVVDIDPRAPRFLLVPVVLDAILASRDDFDAAD